MTMTTKPAAVAIARAEDILAGARNCVECASSAAESMWDKEANPISTVLEIASNKIDEAIALLDEYRNAGPRADREAA
jgi:hypothetical protein